MENLLIDFYFYDGDRNFLFEKTSKVIQEIGYHLKVLKLDWFSLSYFSIILLRTLENTVTI